MVECVNIWGLHLCTQTVKGFFLASRGLQKLQIVTVEMSICLLVWSVVGAWFAQNGIQGMNVDALGDSNRLRDSNS